MTKNKILTPNSTEIVNKDGKENSPEYPLYVREKGKADLGNSTTTNLPGNTGGEDHIYTGTGIDTTPYSAVTVFVTTDVASAVHGLQVEVSPDNVNWYVGEQYTILAGAEKFFTPTMQMDYLRIKYTNGTSGQGNFLVRTMVRPDPIKWSSHNINDPIKNQDDAELVKAVLTGQGEDTIFHNARVGSNGVLYTSDYLLEVAKGNIPGEHLINKFGANPSITTSTDPEDIWDAGGIYAFYPTTAQPMEAISSVGNDTGVVLSSGTATGGSLTTLIDTGATFQTDTVAVGDCLINDTNNEFSIILSIDSEIQVTVQGMSNAFQEAPASTANVSGDSYRIVNANDTGAAVIGVYGLDENWLSQNEFIVLNGATAVDLANTYIRMNRAFVVIAGSSGGAVGTLTVRIDPAGTTALQILNGNNQTLMTVYSTAATHIGYFLQGYVAVSKGAGAATVGANFSWRARIFGGVFAIKGLMTLNSSGSGWWQYAYKGAPGLPPMSDIVIRCDEVTASIGVVAGMDILLIDV